MIKLNRFLMLAFVVLMFFSSLVAAQEEPVPVVVNTLKETALTHELELSGTLSSLRDAQLSMAVSALVQDIYVDVGHRVKKGDTLLSLDNTIATGEHARAQAQLEATEVTYAEAQRLLAEAKQLRKKNHISESEVKGLENAERLASAQLSQARAEALVTKKLLTQHRLQAPFDGVISHRNTDLGQWLNPGDAVFTLVSLDQIYLDVQLPQEYLSQASNIAMVRVSPDIQTNIEIPAHVETLVPIGETARSFLLRIRLKKSSELLQELLLPGTSATARLMFEQSERAILLPRDALLRNVDGNFSVFVIENEIAKRRSIELGLNHQTDFWIKAGLKAGENVVVRGNELLSEGQKVSVIKTLDQQP